MALQAARQELKCIVGQSGLPSWTGLCIDVPGRLKASGDAVLCQRYRMYTGRMVLQEDNFVDIKTSSGPMRTHIFRPKQEGRYPGVIFYSEIFQLTGPIRRFAAFLAGQGYLVAVP